MNILYVVNALGVVGVISFWRFAARWFRLNSNDTRTVPDLDRDLFFALRRYYLGIRGFTQRARGDRQNADCS